MINAILSLTLAAATPAAPAAAAKTAVEFPLSCNAQAKVLFAQGRDTAANAQIEDARELFKKVLVADPKCVLAKLYLGRITAGADGKAMVDEAVASQAGLS